MPELPEVQTTVNGLREHVVGLQITDVWSDYNSPYYIGSDSIKDPKYFAQMKKEVIGKTIVSVARRAKNILIILNSGDIILVHMKMTGHLLYGTYKFNTEKKSDPWEAIEPEALKDPFNKHVHFLISFSNKKHLALSDVRKFAKVTLIHSRNLLTSAHLMNIGPEPLEQHFSLTQFVERITMRPNGKIKQVLIDQSIIAGIGNIYADESLWHAGIHPLQKVHEIPNKKIKVLFDAIKTTLSKGIDFGGDSTSDYRNVLGDKGEFHMTHHAYQRTGSRCDKKGCGGTIERIVLGGRGTHFCYTHQKLCTTK
ncbi:MAG: bifunctional DNA-formamidopyrimidine glycosylase/DNA-(apurinic or apyrimidinic site) lyase [bacterium]|nr:bifunctional DNA-formamidopyrimidine glycosylase/DNA-(apurinic or apyrimidinic site) lyase [bacterium]